MRVTNALAVLFCEIIRLIKNNAKTTTIIHAATSKIVLTTTIASSANWIPTSSFLDMAKSLETSRESRIIPPKLMREVPMYVL